MHHRPFGATGFAISALGFGAMRLPMARRNGADHVRFQTAIRMLRHAFDLGVNYVDTAYGYCNGESEIAVGRALKGYRDRVRLSTKLPLWQVKKRADFRLLLDEQLRKLDTDHIDFYHLHGVSAARMKDTVLKFHLIEEAEKAKAKGLIRNLSFSFHDKPEAMKPIIDTGVFASVLCQYNLLDRSNEKMIAYAKSKGLGVVVMGPVGGGRLGCPSPVIQRLLGRKAATSAEIALRFVLSNPNVDCALSGMSAPEQVDENVAVASNKNPLTGREHERVNKAMDELKELANLYCTGCAYCMPCPQDVNIPACFEALNYYRVYKLMDVARGKYNGIGKGWIKGKKADACIACGVCEAKCPQNIPIRKQLREVQRVFAS
ncbi:aldo/keto reductase [bacterium]|nr:aldo/keto reductase [bacterium]